LGIQGDIAMIESCQHLLLVSCLVAIGGIVLTVFCRYVAPWLLRHISDALLRYLGLGPIGMLVVGACTVGVILYGGGKNGDSADNPPDPSSDEQVVPGDGWTGGAASEVVSPLARVEKWSCRGAWEDGIFIQFDSDWCFPLGPDHLAGVELWSNGKLFATEKSALPFAELMTPLALAPGESEVLVGRTANNSYRFEWLNAHPNRDANSITNAAIELFRNGDIEVTEGGLTMRTSRELPFPHDGFGQGEDWIFAKFTNATEIVACGYTNWVNGQVGTDLTNGLYKFTAKFMDDPPEATLLYVGDWSITVTNAGEYVFVMEKGVEYEFGTWPFNDGVQYMVWDDMGMDAPIMTEMSYGFVDTQGKWTIDGGWNWLVCPDGCLPGSLCWLPTLQGSPDIDSVSPSDFPMTFTAMVTDYHDPDSLYYEWQSSNPAVHIASPHARQTSVSIDSTMALGDFDLSVSTMIGGQYLCSHVGSSEVHKEEVHDIRLFLDVAPGIPVNSARIEGGIVMDCDIETNGWLVLEFDAGADKVSLWGEGTNNVAFICSNRVSSSSRVETRFFVQGERLSQNVDDVNWRLTFVSDDGNTNSVCRSSTVYACYCEPITIDPVSPDVLYNPSCLAVSSNGWFKITTNPTTIPDSNISWRPSRGNATFVGPSTGRQVCISSSVEGILELEVVVFGTTDERMYYSVNVVP